MKQDIHTYTRTHHCYVPDYTYLTHTQKECEITHTALMLVDHTHIAQVLERVRGEREIIIFVCCGTRLVIGLVWVCADPPTKLVGGLLVVVLLPTNTTKTQIS